MAIRIGHGFRMPLIGLQELQRSMVQYRDAIQREARITFLLNLKTQPVKQAYGIELE